MNEEQGTHFHRIKTFVQDFYKLSCHLIFRFTECEAQCILGESGILRSCSSFVLFSRSILRMTVSAMFVGLIGEVSLS